MSKVEIVPLILYIFILGCTTSIEDIRTGKIKNHWIISSMVFTLCFYFLSFITSYIQYVALAWNIVRDISVNSGLALLAGVVLWKAGIWPPGDAKLFFAYALLIPLSYYTNGYLPYFPSFALLVNIFIAGFVYVTLTTALSELKLRTLALWVEKYIFKRKVRGVINAANLWKASAALTQKFLGSMAVIILVMPVREKAFAFFFAQYAFLLAVVFLFAYGYIQKFFLKTFTMWQLALFIFIYAVLHIAIGNGSRFLQYFLGILKISLLFMFLGEGVGGLLKLYMNYLGKEETKEKKESLDPRNMFSDYVSSESGNNSSSIAFAPLMFCGVLMTLLMKQSVVHYVLHLLRTR